MEQTITSLALLIADLNMQVRALQEENAQLRTYFEAADVDDQG